MKMFSLLVVLTDCVNNVVFLRMKEICFSQRSGQAQMTKTLHTNSQNKKEKREKKELNGRKEEK